MLQLSSENIKNTKRNLNKIEICPQDEDAPTFPSLLQTFRTNTHTHILTTVTLVGYMYSFDLF